MSASDIETRPPAEVDEKEFLRLEQERALLELRAAGEAWKEDLALLRAGAEELVRAHPYASVAAGAALGVALGLAAPPPATRAARLQARSWLATLRRIVGVQVLRGLVG